MLILLIASLSCLLGFLLASWSYKLEYKKLGDGIFNLSLYDLNDLLFYAGIKYVKFEDGHIKLYDYDDQLIESSLSNLIQRLSEYNKNNN